MPRYLTTGKVPGESASSSDDSSSGCDNDTCVSILGSTSPVSKSSDLSIEGVFPALAASFKLFERLAKARDLVGLRNLCAVFINNLHTVYYQLKNAPAGVEEDMRFIFSKYQLRFCLKTLQSHMNQSLPAKPSKEELETFMTDALAILTTTKIRFGSFIGVLNHLINGTNPSPPPKPRPSPSSTPVSVSPSGSPPLPPSKSGPPNVPPSSKPPFAPTSLMKPTPLVPQSYSTDTLVTNKTTSSTKSFLRKFLRAFSESKLTLTASSSSLTLVDLPPLSDTSTIVDLVQPKKLPELPYEPRRSAVFFPVGIDFSQVDVEKLMPCPDDNTIRLTPEGKLRAATLTSLVRILTSPEASRMTDFTAIFFTCFRFFTTPNELYTTLVDRFNVRSVWLNNPKLDAAQRDLIERQAEEVRISVVRAFTTWLWDYWRPETDTPVLTKIMRFATHEVVQNVPNPMIAWGLAQATWRIDSGKARYGHKVRSFLALPTEITPPTPTGYNIFKLCSDGPPSLHAVFDSESGREEFARQITIKASTLFFAVASSDAIMLWRGRTKGLDKSRRALEELTSLENSLCLWVLESILKVSGPINRAVVVEYWVDIASRCLALRNYSIAYSVYSALSNSVVSRMKITTGLVFPAYKAKYCELEALFSGNSWAQYRKEFDGEQKPAVPLLFVFKRDIITSEELSSKLASKDGEQSLINFGPVRTMKDTITAMDGCRVQYYLSNGDDFQDWLKGQLRPHQLTQVEDARRMNDLYSISKRHEPSAPPALKDANVWAHSIESYWPEYPGPYRT